MDGEYIGQLVSAAVVPLIIAIGAAVHVAVGRRGAEHPPGWALGVWLRWWFLGAIAFGATAVFLAHFLIPTYMAASLGFDRSVPFQREIAFANLGFAVTAVLALRRDTAARLAFAWGYLVFLYGATAGHLYETIAHGDAAPGNGIGIVIYDLVIPAVAVWLVLRERRAVRPEGEREGVV